MPIWVHLVCNATMLAPKNATTHAPKACNSVKFCSTESSDVNPQDDAAHL